MALTIYFVHVDAVLSTAGSYYLFCYLLCLYRFLDKSITADFAETTISVLSDKECAHVS